jgi:drug/metabolite transporter (DMT)-like permease
LSEPGRTPIPRRALLLLALLTVVWGTNWGLFPYAVREVSVVTFRAVSTLGAGLTLLAVARWRGLPLAVPRRLWPTIALATSLYLLLWNVASTYAAVMIPSGQAAVLGFTMPLWAAFFGWAVLGQRLGGRLLLGLALGAAAVGLLAWRSLGAYAQAPLGVALGLLAAIGWAVGTMVLKRGQQREPALATLPALVITGWQLLGTSVPLGVAALALGHQHGAAWFWPGWPSVLLIAYITLVPMAVGNAAWFAIVGLLPTTVAGLSSILVPVVAMATGALVHGEPMGPAQLAAMACCGAALWLVLRPR